MSELFTNGTAAGAATGFAISVNEPAAIGKEAQLLDSLRRIDSLLIAFSGGADSAYLAWAAAKALGERALAVTALSASYSSHDRSVAAAFRAESRDPPRMDRNARDGESALYRE